MRGTPEERFDAKYTIDLEPNPIMRTACWRWTAYTNRDGYGTFFGAERKMILAHRASYERFVGPLSDVLELDHRCRVTCCVNPGHLEQVTHKVNMERGIGVGAMNSSRTHCPKGHPYTGDNLYTTPGDRARQCRVCIRAASNKYYHKNKETCRAKKRALYKKRKKEQENDKRSN